MTTAQKKKMADTITEMPAGIRDRVKEFRRVPSEELMDNERNWRVHPYAQKAALGEVLDEIGIAGALTAYYSKRNGGKLTLIDGHERRGHQADWPTLILDVSDEEADMLLATFDPIGELAEIDGSALLALMKEVQVGTPGLVDLFQSLDEYARDVAYDDLVDDPDQDAGGELYEDKQIPEMELQPYEHYDYVVLICRNTYDWMALTDLLGVEKSGFTLPDHSRRIGMGRVVDARRVLDLAKEADNSGETAEK